MWNTPTNERLDMIPRLYETENIELRDKTIYMHFFIFGSDWYIAEFDGNDIFFGFVILNQDYLNAEWGYVSFSELKNIRHCGIEVDFDLHWKVRKAIDVDTICKARRW